MPSRRAVTIAAAGGVLYCAAVTLYLIVHGGFPTPDFLIPPLLLPALVARRGRAFVVDWVPFLVLLLAWEATRGIADSLGRPVQFTGPVVAEKLLFFGTVPTVALQEALFVPERGARWFDWLGAFFHSLHFVLPVAFGFVLWLRDRALYRRYVASVLVLFVLGFVGFVLYPQAPPWMAGEIDVIPFVHRIGVEAMLTLPTADGVFYLYDHIRPNNVAAMPSLHAALPLLLTLIVWRSHRPLALVGAVYTVLLAFFLVYQGEHYVVDILAGWALAGLVFWLIWATPTWLLARLPAAPAARRRALAVPATVASAALLVVGTAVVLRPNAFDGQTSALTPAQEAHDQGATATPAAAQPTPAAPEPVVTTADGPCGSARALTAIADGLLAPVAGAAAAYLIDADQGLCLALTSAQTPPPPAIDERRALAARSRAASVNSTVEMENVGGGVVRIAAMGRPSAWLTGVGLPSGSYVLLILLRDVSDDEAARRAAGGLAQFVFADTRG